jgi:2-hydroxychromene-2-carboxylate isomerase
MNKPVEFFFDFISPFGWFAAERIGGIVRAHGRNVAWKPLLLGVTVKQTMGLPAVLQTPLKGPYPLHDAARCARLYRLPWRPPTPITFSSVAAERAVVWAVARGDLDVEALVLGLDRQRVGGGGRHLHAGCGGRRGFFDQGHLSKSFRRLVGLSPCAWQRSHRS